MKKLKRYFLVSFFRKGMMIYMINEYLKFCFKIILAVILSYLLGNNRQKKGLPPWVLERTL